MTTQVTERTQVMSAEVYQMIKDEHLASVVITHQTLSGSRVLMSTYLQVVFSECNFYACEFQGVTFKNCIFENCNFAFSHIRNCKFVNCSFHDCKWQSSSSIISVYKECELEGRIKEMASTSDNETIAAGPFDHTTDIYIRNLLAA